MKTIKNNLTKIEKGAMKNINGGKGMVYSLEDLGLGDGLWNCVSQGVGQGFRCTPL